MKAKINWGIIGLGNIATKFVENLKLFEDAHIAAVASRSLDRAKQFSEQHNIGKPFDSYDELFAYDEVDIVYIATPHRFHKELAIRAMDAGKSVLCEKPLAVNKSEVEELIVSAQKNKVFLMEALWSRFNPSIKKVKEIVDNGDIGDIAHLNADFAFFAMHKGEDSRLLNPELASGSLLDVGIYPIFLSYLLLGKPDNIHASSSFYPNGTELQTSMIFDYSSAQSLLYSGLTYDSEMRAEIFGTKGKIIIHPRWHEAREFSLIKNDEAQTFQNPLKGNGLYHEIEEVHRCLREKRKESPLWTHQNSLDLIELLDSVRAICGITFPFE